MTACPPPAAGRYLTFHLGRSRYALPITSVREVVRLGAVTQVPQMPDYVRGVINLRGIVLAVVDLRAKFQMATIPTHERTCLIVVDHQVDGRAAPVGAIVDGVDDVQPFTIAQLAPPPDFAGAVDPRFLSGVALTADGIHAILNLPEILALEATLALPDFNDLPNAERHRSE